MFNLLSDKEKSLMAQYIDWYAFREGGNSNRTKASLEYIMRYWVENKSKWLSRLFDNKLILKKDLVYEKDVAELAEELSDNLVYNIEHETFTKAYRSLIRWDDEYRSFSESNEPKLDYHLNYLLEPHTLAKNVYCNEPFAIPNPKGTMPIKVQKGCKVSKILGKIAEAYDLPDFEKFRIAHSQILNQKKLKGKLCISIHPLDYMTMSDNYCGWTSCMNWKEGGEFRRGTVEMMNSESVIVAYLESDNPFHLFDGNTDEDLWSNKKWRELFIVNHDLISGVKQYPYVNSYLEKEVSDWLKELAEKNLEYKYLDTYYEFETDEKYIKDEIFSEPVNIRCHTNAMYNDFDTIGHCGYVNVGIETSYSYNYSGPAVCMHCGEKEGDNNTWFDEGESALVCDDCEEVVHCCDCDSRFTRDELYEVNGELYCEYCYNNRFTNCALCDESEHEDNMHTLYVATKKPNGDLCIFRGGIVICEDCFNNIESVENFVREGREDNIKIHSIYYGYEFMNYVFAEDLCDEALACHYGFENLEQIIENANITIEDNADLPIWLRRRRVIVPANKLN